jgi:hypothetical protein
MAKRYQREVIRSRKSKKNRQHNGQNKKYRRTNNIVHDKIALTMRYHKEYNKYKLELSDAYS